MRQALCLCTAALIGACAAVPYQEGNLQQLKRQQARELALACYQQSEGLRFVHGDPTIWIACSRWAARQTP
jgi:hypothetical protein